MNKEEERIGWVTTSANRRKMLDELAMDIRKKELKIYDEDILSEMLTFVINERTNEPRPESGRFSDLIMALAICNQIVKSTGNQAKWAPQQNLRPEDKRRHQILRKASSLNIQATVNKTGGLLSA